MILVRRRHRLRKVHESVRLLRGRLAEDRELSTRSRDRLRSQIAERPEAGGEVHLSERHAER